MSDLNFDIVSIKDPSEVAADTTLSNVYHKGQQKIWDGRKVLDELIAKHGKPKLEIRQKHALIKVLTLILWGELAAWKTSAILSADIDDMGAKLAATSQTHDEARHFYVMLDYMRKVLDYQPEGKQYLSDYAEVGLNEVVNTSSMARRILGMQLMVEPVAITIFRQLREGEVEPILSELLTYYEKDEARHIALGVKYLPLVIKKMTFSDVCQLFVWQCKMLKYEVDGLKDIAPSFDMLGIKADDVLSAAEKRQKEAAQDMVDELGWNLPIVSAMDRFLRAYINLKWFGKSYVGAARELVGV